MNDNYCVCCGEIIPEGRMVCLQCEHEVEKNNLEVNVVSKNLNNFSAVFIEWPAEVNPLLFCKSVENDKLRSVEKLIPANVVSASI